MIFVSDFPYIVPGNEIDIDHNLSAAFTSTDIEKDVNGKEVTAAYLEYGEIYVVPPEILLKQQQARDKKGFESLMKSASNGEEAAQCSIGIRYLSGKGCETNRFLAVHWLKMSSDQGDIEASNILVRIQSQTNSVLKIQK